MSGFSRRFARDKEGSVAVEFAFLAPVLLLLTFGLIEAANYLYAGQKVKNATFNILNIINLQENVSTEQLEAITEIVPQVAEPIRLPDDDYQVIVTAMQLDRLPAEQGEYDGPYVLWQESHGGALAESRFDFTDGASRDTNAVDPADVNSFVFARGDQLIAIEVFARYGALLASSFIGAQDFSVFATSRPRKGAFQFRPDEIR